MFILEELFCDIDDFCSDKSANFPNFSLIQVIPQYLNQCRTEGRNKGIKAFRSWVKEQI